MYIQCQNGTLKPQGEFDLDPAEYLKTYQKDQIEFEYLGIENISMKKGEARSEHHKIKVKSFVLKPLVLDLIAKDKYLIPVHGKILTYQQFFARICKIREPAAKRKLKESKDMEVLAKKNTLLLRHCKKNDWLQARFNNLKFQIFKIKKFVFFRSYEIIIYNIIT